MLSSVKSTLSEFAANDVPFSAFYDDYVCKIQDMDIDNEILPLIKQESTKYLAEQRKLARLRKRRKGLS